MFGGFFVSMALQQWQEELRRTVRTLEDLEQYLPIANKEAMKQVLGNMRLAITPHTLKLINFADPHDPLLLMSVPQEAELRMRPEELRDPIGDEAKSPIPFLTHRYPDRVLVYATFSCSHYCRFCFRRFKTGQANPGPGAADYERICAYLRAHPEVDEVILTGGDPLTLTDEQLNLILSTLRGVLTIARIRIHTRVPVNLPSRITPELCSLLQRHQSSERPLYVVTHFNHPRELAPENIRALAMLVDHGMVVRNQSVLLRGVNDSLETLQLLLKRLVNIRVVPYYIHQLDVARGTSHFRVPLERGLALLQALQGRVTGIAIPRFMLEIPGGGGKVPLQASYLRVDGDGHFEIRSPLSEAVYPYDERLLLEDA